MGLQLMYFYFAERSARSILDFRLNEQWNAKQKGPELTLDPFNALK